MDDLMTLSTHLISLETRRLETTIRNLANVATPGYRREVAFQDVLANDASNAVGAPPPRHVTDFSAGRLVHTADPFDLAIAGDGFFEVATDAGLAYTRAGTFRRAPDGRMVTRAGGWPLQGTDGDVVVSADGWRVDPDGTVIDHGVSTSTIRVVAFDEPSRLRRIADGLYAPDSAHGTPIATARLAQGFVETSNVNAADDMVRLVEAMRRVETGQKLVHAYDDLMGTVLQRLGGM
ncbi:MULTISPECIES: flagellar hook-basal body protein [Burkholderia]|uniref:Flagellar basal-body rod protein FlgG n=1 Tax=Burkholderia pyrrocinia TaxID=60550 RepID=A0A318IMF9_BURPY|nr:MULTISPECIES: flagellar hook basal-body protein [Burkholderia]PXX35456.1 flagellar basal-body rod protein FlgG [Burkholderia pyrrocinia]SFW41729.1 flagellar basal-body rod protein FlgG [Burkholderia sp. NFACC33-1]SFX70910.1 flagellar basal-body rod protein FlgG [Burkholderia sp. NFPP32]